MQNVPGIVVTCSSDAKIQQNLQIADTPFLTDMISFYSRRKFKFLVLPTIYGDYNFLFFCPVTHLFSEILNPYFRKGRSKQETKCVPTFYTFRTRSSQMDKTFGISITLFYGTAITQFN